MKKFKSVIYIDMQLTLDISNTRYLDLFGISNKYLGPLAIN